MFVYVCVCPHRSASRANYLYFSATVVTAAISEECNITPSQVGRAACAYFHRLSTHFSPQYFSVITADNWLFISNFNRLVTVFFSFKTGGIFTRTGESTSSIPFNPSVYSPILVYFKKHLFATLIFGVRMKLFILSWHF